MGYGHPLGERIQTTQRSATTLDHFRIGLVQACAVLIRNEEGHGSVVALDDDPLSG
jgi:hypothetical protein